jgi:hypothetical protein
MFEWACFLVFHHPRSIFIGFWSFGTLSSIAKRLKHLSVLQLKCTVRTDGTVLMEKVLEHYRSFASFERFVRVTVLALVVRDLFRGIAKSKRGMYRKHVMPMLDLASTLKFHKLRDLLGAFDAPQIFRNHGRYDGEDAYVSEVHAYFEEFVYPHLLEERCIAEKRTS